MLIRDLLRWGKDQLSTKDISSVDAELLLAHILGLSRMELHSKPIELGEEEARVKEEFEDAIALRLTGKPTQYITGEAPFRYLTLDVGPGVLIPRPETEVLVDEVLHHLAGLGEPISVIDLGSGSGAIAISLASETAGKKIVHVVAVEKSEDALPWLRQNIAKFDLPIRVIAEDVTTALQGVKCDVIVANPPYIPQSDQLPREVADFEPELALRGGNESGMAVPQAFIATAARLLKSGGVAAFEHHESQVELMREALSTDFTEIKIHYDLTERPRFTTAIRK